MVKRMLNFAIIATCIALFLYWENNSIVVSKYIYKSEKISQNLDGVKLLHISDFHNKKFINGGKGLIAKIKKQNPDLIFITGDIIDRRSYDLEIAANLCEELVKIAPSYYVSGNHEAWSGKYDEITKMLKTKGVIVLENEIKEYSFENEKIKIYGMAENMEKRGGISQDSKNLLEKSLIKGDKEELLILLSHRPELFPLYKDYNFDLVFAGHAHGGQVRLPFLGALFAPDQGIFPKYSAGKYVQNNTSMLLSRGLGNSAFPIRLFNRPELILVELSQIL